MFPVSVLICLKNALVYTGVKIYSYRWLLQYIHLILLMLVVISTDRHEKHTKINVRNIRQLFGYP